MCGTFQPDGEELRNDTAHVLASVDQMHLLLRLVELVEALGEAPPVGQDSEHYGEPVSCRAVTFQVDVLTIDEGLLVVVAHDVEEMLDRTDHRCDDIGQEEVSEPDIAKR